MRAWIWLSVILVMINSCQQNNTEDPSSAKDTASVAADTVKTKGKNIVFFGNSITAGYGLDLTEAFPARIQDKLDSMGLPYTVVNAGVSGETSSGGNSRIDWILKQPVDIFVLELGGNDGLRGIALQQTSQNLQAIIDQVKAKYPDVKILLTGMRIPPNMGKKYADEFQQLYKTLAEKNNID